MSALDSELAALPTLSAHQLRLKWQDRRCGEPTAAASRDLPAKEPDRSKSAPSRSGRRWRCAIYTRKSSEEGLEQAFNSLHAQREACEAYIQSQRHEGWTCLPQAYDDGGLSGATLDRPALQQLLADIQEGRVDVIVCYKVDR